MASSGSHDSPPARRHSGSQLLQELEALSQSLYISQHSLVPRRTGSLSLPDAKKLRTREEHAVLDEAIPLPGLANARHNSVVPNESRNFRHSISHPQPVESNVMGVKAARFSSSSAASGFSSEKVDIRGRRNQYSLSPLRRRKGEELNRPDDRNTLRAHQEEEDVDFSKKMDRKHSGFWAWKPIRALSHIGMHRFNCIFSVYVNAIHGLSPSVNGLRLAVNLRRKESRDGAVQTMPARVFQSVAEFDETLRIHCHVYGSNSRHGTSHGILKFQSRPFTVYVVAVDAEELDFGKHHVDLGTLLQEAVQKHPAGEDSDDGWNASFALSGKARGAELVVGLGYEILDKDERYHIGSCRFKDYSDHQAHSSPWGISKSLPNSVHGTPKKAARGFPGDVNNSASPFRLQMDRDDPIDFVRMAHLNLDDPDLITGSALLSQMFENENLTLNTMRSEGANLGLGEVHEQENSTSEAVNHPPDQEIENADDEEFFEVEEQGVELVENEAVEDETATTSEQLEKEGSGSASGGHEVVKEVIQEASQRRLIELDAIAQQISVLESVIVDKTASHETATEPLRNQDSKLDYKIHNDAVKSDQKTDDLMDDEAGAVEGEFLHMLEDEEIDLGSQENIAKSALNDGTADSEEDMDQLTSILAELAETELKKMSHDSESKARAKLLEVEENEALMQKMGLNEKLFRNSSRNSDAFGNIFDKTMKKQIKRPVDLGDGLGSHVVQVQTRDGGMLASMNPAHFRSGGRLVMHVSKPVVLPAEMGDTAIEILQKMAGLGTTNMTSQAIDCMPLDNITGKTVEQIAFEGMASAITKNGYSQQNANPKDQAGKGSLLSKGFGPILAGSQKSKAAGIQSRGTILDECVTVDNLVSLAMQRIEAMALEGLKIQAEMAEEEAPYSVPSVPLAKQSKINGDCGITDGDCGITDSKSSNSKRLMAVAISLEEWMGLDSGLYDAVAINENTRATLAAHHAALKHQDWQAFADKQKKREGEGRMAKSLTVALLVQLRDPLRNYEAVGCPMIGLVEAERVVDPSGSNKELTKEDWDPPRFKIRGVHMSGLKVDEKKKLQRAIWGSQQHQYHKSTASRWLIANGMAKNNRHTNSFLKSKAQQHPANIKAGEFVWSISSGLNSSSTGRATVHIRNPDIVIPNQALSRRV